MTKDKNNLHEGHRKRVKERLEKEGLDSFSDHNILEVLLFYSIQRKDTNEAAHLLLEKFGTFDRVFDAEIDELTEVKGITNHSASLIKLVGEAWRRYTISKNNYESSSLNSIEKAGEYVCTRLMGSNHEKFLVVCLNSRLNILGSEILFDGTVNRAMVDVRKISEYALRKKSSAVIIAHNHPSGILEPSDDDINLTAKIADALKILNIDFVDHFICFGTNYYSMAQEPDFECLFN